MTAVALSDPNLQVSPALIPHESCSSCRQPVVATAAVPPDAVIERSIKYDLFHICITPSFPVISKGDFEGELSLW